MSLENDQSKLKVYQNKAGGLPHEKGGLPHEKVKIPRILVAGAHSGSGKTTLTLGLLYLLKKQGFEVSPFKVGPDFIDPGHHSRISGLASRNLDGWMLSKEYNLRSFIQHAQGKDLALIEGVMGLFDGLNGLSEDGSSAQVAKWLNCPVVLIIDCRSMARSVAALIQGYENFDRQVPLAGVILNRVGSPRHFTYLKEAVETYCHTEVLGYLPRDESLTIPERHLGLVTAEEGPLPESFLSRLSCVLEEKVNIERILAIAQSAQEMTVESTSSLPFKRSLPFNPPREGSYAPAFSPPQRMIKTVAVARDEAFCFYYQDNFDLIRQAGAELLFFSPLRDRSIPASCEALYLGGGYPELYGPQLSQNASMLGSIRSFIEEGGHVLAECGGFVYLTKGIQTFDKQFFPLAGIFPVCPRMERKVHLGYREIHISEDCPLGLAGSRLRGHEFHYSTTERMPDTIQRAYEGFDSNGTERKIEGFRYKNCLAGYPHIHFGSHPESIYSFLQKF
jgi:cobyrinic acid a,c-diamide synthase